MTVNRWSRVLSILRGSTTIESDEFVVFFPTFAHLEGPEWVLDIHGWIFEPSADSLVRKAAVGLLCRSLRLEKEAEESAIFRQRAMAFLVDNERRKRLSIKIGNVTYELA